MGTRSFEAQKIEASRRKFNILCRNDESRNLTETRFNFSQRMFSPCLIRFSFLSYTKHNEPNITPNYQGTLEPCLGFVCLGFVCRHASPIFGSASVD